MNEEDLIIANRRNITRGGYVDSSGKYRYYAEPDYVYEYGGDADGLISFSVAGQESIAKAERILAGIDGGFEKALQSAINRVAARLRSNSTKAIRERYAISAANAREYSTVHVSYDSENGVQASVSFSGALIPLYRFDGVTPSQPTRDTSGRLPVMTGEDHWRMVYPSVPAIGHVLKATSPYHFEKAFVARMTRSTNHVGIFERTKGMTSRGKDEIAELFGPSVPQMLGSEAVEKVLVDDSMQSFEKDLDHSVMAILSGYMR